MRNIFLVVDFDPIWWQRIYNEFLRQFLLPFLFVFIRAEDKKFGILEKRLWPKLIEYSSMKNIIFCEFCLFSNNFFLLFFFLMISVRECMWLIVRARVCVFRCGEKSILIKVQVIVVVRLFSWSPLSAQVSLSLSLLLFQCSLSLSLSFAHLSGDLKTYLNDMRNRLWCTLKMYTS